MPGPVGCVAQLNARKFSHTPGDGIYVVSPCVVSFEVGVRFLASGKLWMGPGEASRGCAAGQTAPDRSGIAAAAAGAVELCGGAAAAAQRASGRAASRFSGELHRD